MDVESSGGSKVLTYDDGAIGILAQSVGAAAAMARMPKAFLSGWAARAAMAAMAAASWSISAMDGPDDLGSPLSAKFAAGVIAQSVGGGGGNGGYATTTGPLITGAVGGVRRRMAAAGGAVTHDQCR